MALICPGNPLPASVYLEKSMFIQVTYLIGRRTGQGPSGSALPSNLKSDDNAGLLPGRFERKEVLARSILSSLSFTPEGRKETTCPLK